MRVGEKGQVTIPVEFRRALGLHAGDEVEFEWRESELVLRRGAGRGNGSSDGCAVRREAA